MTTPATPAPGGNTDGAGGEKTAEQLAAEKTATDKAATDAAAKKEADDKAAAEAAAGNKGGEKGTKASPAPAGPPADGKYTLELPEDAIVDDADLEKIVEVAKAKGWSIEAAQAALVEYDAALKANSEGFLAETKADKTLGGKNFAETTRLSNLALDTLRPAGTPEGDELRTLLTKSGYGNNRVVIGLLADLGKMMAEDGPLKIPGKATSAEVRPEDRMYPTTVQKPEERGT